MQTSTVVPDVDVERTVQNAGVSAPSDCPLPWKRSTACSAWVFMVFFPSICLRKYAYPKHTPSRTLSQDLESGHLLIKGPCSYISFTWALNGLSYYDCGADVLLRYLNPVGLITFGCECVPKKPAAAASCRPATSQEKYIRPVGTINASSQERPCELQDILYISLVGTTKNTQNLSWSKRAEVGGLGAPLGVYAACSQTSVSGC